MIKKPKVAVAQGMEEKEVEGVMEKSASRMIN
jgi:hypothetical protein